MNNRESYFKAVAWSLDVTVKYVKSHYEDYIQLYDFKPEHFYKILQLFIQVDKGRIITKYGFQ